MEPNLPIPPPEEEKPIPKVPLPQPAEVPNVPRHLRWPLEGKMETPTVPPRSVKELARARRRRGLRGFLIGLLVGQVVIATIMIGGDELLKLRPDLRMELPLRAIVFVGIGAGIAFTGSVTGLLLLLQGLGYVLRPRGKPFATAAWNGLKRFGRAALALGATFLVLGGTAAAAIPPRDWIPHGKLIRDRAKRISLPIRDYFRR